jgi:hypothetical protein
VIEDDGRGFDPEAVRAGALGFTGHARARRARRRSPDGGGLARRRHDARRRGLIADGTTSTTAAHDDPRRSRRRSRDPSLRPSPRARREADIEVVGEAESADRAVFETISNKPDVVVMDLVMPGKSGIEGMPPFSRRPPT